MNVINEFPCIKGWTTGRVLGTGTVGTIVLACKNNKSQCAAMKVQILTTKAERDSFKVELANQLAFGSMAPEVYDHCMIKSDGVRYGVIVMELLDEELDEFLSNKQSTADLIEVAERIQEFLEYMALHNLTHGDLALFNMAFTKNDRRLIMLDFDRSSTLVYHPSVDALRLHIELYKKTQSENTKDTLSSNLAVLRKNLGGWYGAVNMKKPKGSAPVIDELWYKAYGVYCKKANIKCLE